MSFRSPRRASFFPRLVPLEDRATPATFTVTNLNDAGAGSLRDAISQANNETSHPGADVIVFDSAIKGGTITLTSFNNPGVTTSLVPQPAGPSALIVRSEIDIQGTGELLTRPSAGDAFRFFQVTAAGDLTLRRMWLRNGRAVGGDASNGGGGGAGLGGAIYNQGTLALDHCLLSENFAIGGSSNGFNLGGGGGGLGGAGSAGYGGPPNATTPGGFGSGGKASVDGNQGGAGGFGGGAGNTPQNLFNGADGGFGGGGGASPAGGGLGGPGRFGGYATLNRGGGGAALGGAIFNQGGTISVITSTLTGNLVRGGSTDSFAEAGDAYGAGLFNLNGSVTLTGSTFAGNILENGNSTGATYAGGGVLCNVSANVGSNTPSKNALLTASNCIFSHTGTGTSIESFTYVGWSGIAQVTGSGPNIDFSPRPYNGSITGTPFTHVDPLLGPLQNNGGVTPTMLPAAGSPAIDAGSNAAASGLNTDQRWGLFVRVFNGTVDIGAVEVQPTPVPPPPVVPPPPDVPPPPATIVPFLVGGPTDGSVRVLSPAGTTVAFGDAFAGLPGLGVNARTAVADVTGDGVPDYVVGAGPGAVSRVAVLNGTDKSVLVQFSVFEDTFKGGVYVAAADIDGDGKAEVITTADESGGPIVAVYRGSKLAAGVGGQDAQMTRFFGIAGDPNFRGGCRPALADLNGDGAADLVVSAGVQGGPRIAVFDGQSLKAGRTDPGRLVGDFFAFEDTLRNGAFVAAGDVTGDGRADVVFGGGPGGAPRVRLFDGKELLTAPAFSNVDDVAAAAQKANFFAGDVALRGGVRLALHDEDGDGKADLLAGSGASEPSRVLGYRASNLLANANPTPDVDLDPFATILTNGVFVG